MPEKQSPERLNSPKNRMFCNPCGRAWDGIGLVMDVRRVDFPAAVRWLVNQEENEDDD